MPIIIVIFIARQFIIYSCINNVRTKSTNYTDGNHIKRLVM